MIDEMIRVTCLACAASPVRRQGTSEDVANLVYFLVSDEAGFITGANVDINGGMLFS